MKSSLGLIIGITIGVIIGLLLSVFGLLCIRFRRKNPEIGTSCSRRASTIPIRVNGVDSSTIMSDSNFSLESPKADSIASWFRGSKKIVVSTSGIPKYSYRDLQKATHNFTKLIGQGAFGPVYRAEMPTGETVAVKVLAKNSTQSEREFQTEVLLLGRLHHRNLVNLVGYCNEKGHNMLIYVYMSKGSLASHLYEEKHEPLSWDLRVLIAQDVARGLEYLHDGAVPPVLHRDIKSANILLDNSMRARVADFGLSREEEISQKGNDIRGTLGYLDPEYVSTRSYTQKSDVYSYGVMLFELITGKNPNQGLLELIGLAAMNADGKEGWEEIVDPRLDGKYDIQELNRLACLAHKCMNKKPKKRPLMSDIVQTLSRITKFRYSKRHRSSMSFTTEETGVEMSPLESPLPNGVLHREESVDSVHDPRENV